MKTTLKMMVGLMLLGTTHGFAQNCPTKPECIASCNASCAAQYYGSMLTDCKAACQEECSDSSGCLQCIYVGFQGRWLCQAPEGSFSLLQSSPGATYSVMAPVAAAPMVASSAPVSACCAAPAPVASCCPAPAPTYCPAPAPTCCATQYSGGCGQAACGGGRRIRRRGGLRRRRCW